MADGLPKEIRVEPSETTRGRDRWFRLKIDLNLAPVPQSRTIEFHAFGAGGKETLPPIELKIQPPTVDCPKNWERAKPPEDTRLIEVNGKIYPRVIEHAFFKEEHPVVTRLIDRRKDGQPDPFYIMRDKVWVGLFRAFADEDPARVRNSKWNKDADERWPALGVTGPEAQAFAEWLGGPGRGSLPTCDQWDQAAGKNEGDGRTGPFQPIDNPRDCRGLIAVGGLDAKPQPVGSAPLDISPRGCRDMSGNGWEWTRLPPGNTPESLVALRKEL